MVFAQYLFDSNGTQDPNSPTFSVHRSPFVTRFKVLSAHVPVSFYTTGRQNNVVAIRENGTVRYISLPYGNYTSANFPQALQDALGGTYVVTYDEVQRNLKVTNPGVTFSILGLDGGTTAYSQLGSLRTGESATGNTFQGGVSNFTGTYSLLLVCSELMTRDVCYANNSAVNCIGLIEVDTQPGSILHWRNPGSYLEMGANLTTCKFRFLDSLTLNEVDLRGQGFSIQLGILTDLDDPVVFI